MYDTLREIKTGIKYEIGKEVIESMIEQLADGIWEDSPAMEKYWRFIDVDFMQGEVIILVSTERTEMLPGLFEKRPQVIYNAFYNKTDDEIKEWVATKIKAVVEEEEKDSGAKLWDSSCDLELEYMHIGVRAKDAYSVYNALLGRKERVNEQRRRERHYGSADYYCNQ